MFLFGERAYQNTLRALLCLMFVEFVRWSEGYMARTFITFSEPLESALENYPDHVRAIGMIAIEISNLELAISNLLSILLNIDAHRGRIVYFTPKAAIARLDIVRNLNETLDPKHKAARTIIDDILDRSQAVLGKRHEFIHNSWGFSKEHNEVTRTAHPAKRRFAAKPVPIIELNDLTAKIRRVTTDAWNALPKVDN